jgi:hypothetical protein
LCWGYRLWKACRSCDKQYHAQNFHRPPPFESKIYDRRILCVLSGGRQTCCPTLKLSGCPPATICLKESYNVDESQAGGQSARMTCWAAACRYRYYPKNNCADEFTLLSSSVFLLPFDSTHLFPFVCSANSRVCRHCRSAEQGADENGKHPAARHAH